MGGRWGKKNPHRKKQGHEGWGKSRENALRKALQRADLNNWGEVDVTPSEAKGLPRKGQGEIDPRKVVKVVLRSKVAKDIAVI